MINLKICLRVMTLDGVRLIVAMFHNCDVRIIVVMFQMRQRE